jgi:diguanylate cyclase (GGDEF)-like protein/PAS domain S-box-containing protein
MKSIPAAMPANSPDGGALSGRIVSTVFWTMAALGFVGLYVMLGGLRNAVERERTAAVNCFTMEIERALQERDGAGFDKIARTLLAQHDFRGVELITGSGTVRAGVAAADSVSIEQRVSLTGTGGKLTAGRLILHDKPLDQRLEQRRRNAMVILGAVLLSFGYALNQLLRRVLCRPFATMTATASAYAAGDTSRRFDERRTDEFGFLATFINRALDTAEARTAELEQAVARMRATEAALAREKERVEVTLHSIADGVITTDSDGHIEFMNPVALSLSGWTFSEALGRPLEEVAPLVHEESGVLLDHPVRICMDSGAPADAHEAAMLRTRDGRLRHVTVSAAPIAAAGSENQGVVCVIYDTTHTRIMARELSWQASHDELTALANRREFEHQLERFVQQARHGEASSGAVLCVDMDHFKVVNDTHGHAAGDEVLRQFAQLLGHAVRESDLVARLGGDEFAILLRGCDARRAQEVARDLLRRVHLQRFRWEGREFEIGMSIGLVPIDANTASGAEVLRAADVACYCAKESGRDGVHEYSTNDEHLRDHERRMDRAARLRADLQHDRFVLYCQPIARIGSGIPVVEHYEILLRGRDDAGNIVPPGEFIAAAEQYHLMPDVDRWVLRNALAMLRSAADAPFAVAINLSGQTLSRRESLNAIVDELVGSGVPPERVIFEITETAAIANLTHAKRLIAILRGMGCRFALDDFGSGLSSLSYIRELDVAFLKIDGRFVRNMNGSALDRALVGAAQHIGEVLGIETVGEWAENNDVIASLHLANVTYAQGYGIAQPFPFAELLDAEVSAANSTPYTARASR